MVTSHEDRRSCRNRIGLAVSLCFVAVAFAAAPAFIADSEWRAIVAELACFLVTPFFGGFGMVMFWPGDGNGVY